jgi:hypothetical protein
MRKLAKKNSKAKSKSKVKHPVKRVQNVLIKKESSETDDDQSKSESSIGEV